MEQLAQEIENLEISATTDADYRRTAKEFVRKILPEGTGKERFSIPTSFTRLVSAREKVVVTELTFSDLPY
jgi:hypothetical protein